MHLSSIDHIPHFEDILFESPFSKKFTLDPKLIKLKIDGSPSILFGRENNRVWVGLKSCVSTNVKFFSYEDIREKYKDKEELLFVFASVLDQLDSFLPSEECAYQGDVLFSCPDDLITKQNSKGVITEISMLANTIEYRAHKFSSSEIFNRLNSPKIKIGLAVHTIIFGPELNSTDEVFIVDLSVMVQPITYEITVGNIPDFSFAFSEVSPKAYITSAIFNYDDELNHHGYTYFVENRCAKHISKLKTEKGKNKAKEKYQKVIDEIYNRSKEIDNFFDLYSSFMMIKESIMFLIKDNSGLYPFIDGFDSVHEGYVMNIDGKLYKLVNRFDFSNANFANYGRKTYIEEEDDNISM